MSLIGWLFAASALGVLALGVAAYVIAVRFRNQFGFPEPNPSQRSPGEFGLEAEEVSFPTADRPLPGWFVSAGGGRGPALVLVHGWESNHGRMLPMARAFHDAGLHTFLFDARGHGVNPPERYMTAAEFVLDVVAALEFLASRPEVDNIGLFGHSAGGTASILAASRDSRVKAVVSSSAFAGPVELTQRLLGLGGLPTWRPFAEFVARVYVRPRGHRVADYHAWERIAQLSCPVLLVHGENDPYIPPAHMGLLSRAAHPSRSDTWLVPGGGHRDLFTAPGYVERVVEYFLAHLPPGGALPKAAQ